MTKNEVGTFVFEGRIHKVGRHRVDEIARHCDRVRERNCGDDCVWGFDDVDAMPVNLGLCRVREKRRYRGDLSGAIRSDTLACFNKAKHDDPKRGNRKPGED